MNPAHFEKVDLQTAASAAVFFDGFQYWKRALRYVMKWRMGFGFGIFLLPGMLKLQNLRNVPNIPVSARGGVLYCTSQCSFPAKYVPMIKKMAREQAALFKAIHLQRKDGA